MLKFQELKASQFIADSFLNFSLEPSEKHKQKSVFFFRYSPNLSFAYDKKDATYQFCYSLIVGISVDNFCFSFFAFKRTENILKSQ